MIVAIVDDERSAAVLRNASPNLFAERETLAAAADDGGTVCMCVRVGVGVGEVV